MEFGPNFGDDQYSWLRNDLNQGVVEDELYQRLDATFMSIQRQEADYLKGFTGSCDIDSSLEKEKMTAERSTNPTGIPQFSFEHLATGSQDNLEEQKIIFTFPPISISNSSECDMNEREEATLGQTVNDKETRWRRTDDIRLFKALRVLQNQSGSSFKINYQESYSNSQLRLIAHMIGWKGTLQRLAIRIKNRIEADKLSVRELKRFRRIIKKDFAFTPIDFVRLQSEFPGKTVELLRKESEKIKLNKAQREAREKMTKQVSPN